MTQPTTPPPELNHWLDEQLNALGLSSQRLTSPISLSALQTEASFRQFYRINGARRPLVLMDSPPDKEQNAQFVAVAKAFAASGITVPEVLSHQPAKGWLLLTDLGSTHFIDAYRLGKQQECLDAAMNTLVTLSSPIVQAAQTEESIIPPYTQERLSDELDIFIDWLVAEACQTPIPEAVFERARSTLLANARNQPQVCVHRDFHCKNLLFNGAGNPVGVLDFQDALMGPAGYDLASLLHDCYWKFPDAFIDRFIDVLPNTSRRAVDLLAVQRQLKAAGIFARLAIRDNKTSHLPHIEPVLINLCELCSRYPELSALGDWLATHLTPRAKVWVTEEIAKEPLNPAQVP